MSLQSSPTLQSLAGSSVHGILQARTLEWLPRPPPGVKPASLCLLYCQLSSLPPAPPGKPPRRANVKGQLLFLLFHIYNLFLGVEYPTILSISPRWLCPSKWPASPHQKVAIWPNWGQSEVLSLELGIKGGRQDGKHLELFLQMNVSLSHSYASSRSPETTLRPAPCEAHFFGFPFNLMSYSLYLHFFFSLMMHHLFVSYYQRTAKKYYFPHLFFPLTGTLCVPLKWISILSLWTSQVTQW